MNASPKQSNTDNAFIQSLIAADKAALRKIPKTDAHNHSIFGARRKNIEQWNGACLEPPPEGMETLDDMTDYAKRVLYPYFDSRKGFEFTVESSILDAINDGVIYLETTIDIRNIIMYPCQEQDIIPYLAVLKNRYSDKITFRPELGISRDREMRDIEPLVHRCIDSGFFFSIDLYSNELGRAPEVYREFYRKAGRAGMKLKAHTGEFGTAESVRHTVEVLELDEVQHGINAADSQEVMKWLARNNIRLNVCPTSNVMLNRVPFLRVHPIRKLYDYGITVTINTDDPMIFNQSVSDEYLNLYHAGVFAPEELNDIRRCSLEKTS